MTHILVFGASRKFEDVKQWLVDITGDGQKTDSAADDVRGTTQEEKWWRGSI